MTFDWPDPEQDEDLPLDYEREPEVAEDPHEISDLHVVGPGPNGYAVTDDRGTCVADGLSLEAAQGYLA